MILYFDTLPIGAWRERLGILQRAYAQSSEKIAEALGIEPEQLAI